MRKQLYWLSGEEADIMMLLLVYPIPLRSQGSNSGRECLAAHVTSQIAESNENDVFVFQ
jgi:hypothetical protein